MVEIKWLNEDSKTFLENGYLVEGQTVENRIDEICKTAEKILKETESLDNLKKEKLVNGFAEKLKNYICEGYISLSSPIWSNYGTNRGLGISCYNCTMEDSISSILGVNAEVGMMTKVGGGTSIYMGKLRNRGSSISVGGTSYGPVHFAQMPESTIDVVSQSTIRRGNCAVWLGVDHADINEWLEIRTEGHPIQKLSFGVTINNEWMEGLLKGDIDKRKVWGKILKCRYETGYPYILYSDNVNQELPEYYKKRDMTCYSSNLCVETVPTLREYESFVCCLLSINDLFYDEWKNTDLVETVVAFLDTVLSEFISKTENIPYMEKARNFAINQRSIGIGRLGWHSYLQSNMIEFESEKANELNVEIQSFIKNKSEEGSKNLASIYGECEICEGYGLRNAQLQAIAPTTSSAFILGQVSPSIEPLASNYFIKDLAKGRFTYKNPYLKSVLEANGVDNDDTWNSIAKKGGSVQHLKDLSENEKNVFKTFSEINQHEIVNQAAFRQQFIDQGQSLNVMIPHNVPAKKTSELMIKAWQMGVKSLYYQRSTNPVHEAIRTMDDTCTACEA